MEIKVKSLLSLQVPHQKCYFPTPVATRNLPYSQAQFPLPYTTGDVHAHRLSWRLVTQKMRNMSPGMAFQWFVFAALPHVAGRRQRLRAIGAATTLPGSDQLNRSHMSCKVRTTMEK